jgi:hypothetical protein
LVKVMSNYGRPNASKKKKKQTLAVPLPQAVSVPVLSPTTPIFPAMSFETPMDVCAAKERDDDDGLPLSPPRTNESDVVCSIRRPISVDQLQRPLERLDSPLRVSSRSVVSSPTNRYAAPKRQRVFNGDVFVPRHGSTLEGRPVVVAIPLPLHDGQMPKPRRLDYIPLKYCMFFLKELS